VSIALRLMRLPLPDAMKSRALSELVTVTAEAFGSPPPDLRGLSYGARLRSYARFTRDEALRCLREGDAEHVRERLHENARRLGTQLRRRLGVTRIDEVIEAARLLYRVIDIDLAPAADGAIIIQRCPFADVYTADVCRLISALDAGLFDGLSDGAQLEFTARMTEGCDACRAQLTPREVPR
jgi:predicted ArsR family transcriptional regulator